MDAEKLGKEVGLLFAEAYKFIGSILSEISTADNNLKNKVEEKKKEIFNELIPKINASKSLSNDDKELFSFNSAMTMLENIDATEEEMEERGAILDEFENEDRNYMLNIIALHSIMIFTENNIEGDEASELYKHVGL